MSAKRRTKMSKNVFAVCQQVVSVSGIQGRFREGFEILLVAAMLYDLQQFRWELISLAQQGSIPGALHESVDDAEYRVLSGAWWWSGSASDVVVDEEEKVERLTTKFDIGAESRPRHARNAAPAERWIYHLETRQLRNDLKTSPPIDSRNSYIACTHTATMSLTPSYAARTCRQCLRSSSRFAATAQTHRRQQRRWQSTDPAALPTNAKIAGIVDQISQLTLLETADLVSTLKVSPLYHAQQARYRQRTNKWGVRHA